MSSPPQGWALLWLLVRALLVACRMALERRWPALFPLPFPRDRAELMREDAEGATAGLHHLFELLRGRPGSGVPGTAVLVHASELRHHGTTTEPAKQKTSAALQFRWRTSAPDGDGGDEHERSGTTNVFVKFANPHVPPPLLQAFRAVVEPGLSREIHFYNTICRAQPPVGPGVPPGVHVPQALLAVADCSLNRSILVLEYVDPLLSQVIPDWRGAAVPAVVSMVRAAARLHAAWWGRHGANCEALAPVPARGGLDFLNGVVVLDSARTAADVAVWDALAAHFARGPATLCHGDFRAGNMIFLAKDSSAGHLATAAAPMATVAAGTTSGSLAVAANGGGRDGNGGTQATQAVVTAAAAGTEESPPLIVADWEALNIAPPLWDLAYVCVLSMTLDARRAHVRGIINEYYSTLVASGVDAAAYTRERAHTDFWLMVLVLLAYSRTVATGGLWDGQGNTCADWAVWTERIHAAATEQECWETAAAALQLPLELLRTHVEARMPPSLAAKA